MKSSYSSSVVTSSFFAFLILVFFTACETTNTSKNGGKPAVKKNEQTSLPKKTKVIDDNESIVLDLSINLKKQYAINDNIIGFNTGAAFKDKVESHPEVVKLTKALKPRLLRFPGGTISGFYHMTGTGYGMKWEECKGLDVMRRLHGQGENEKENYVENFIRMCKNSHENLEVFVVANMINADVQETIDLVNYLVENGINVIGIELGNELYFDAFKSYFKSVNDYIDLSKSFAADLKKSFPKMDIAVCTGNVMDWQTSKPRVRHSFDKWNLPLAKQDFYDAVVAHVYYGHMGKEPKCFDLPSNDINAIFDCYKDLLSPIKHSYTEQLYLVYKAIFGDDVTIWFNEWNVYKSINYLTNTVLHGAFISEMLLDIIDVNLKYNDPIEYTLIHNYFSEGPLMGGIYYNNSQLPTLNGDRKILAATQYYAHLFMSELIEQEVKLVDSEVNFTNDLDNGDVVVRVFYSPKTAKKFIYFVNKSNKRITFNIQNKPPLINKHAIEGEHLSASGGFGAISRKHKGHYQTCELVNEKVDNFTIKPAGFGYFEF